LERLRAWAGECLAAPRLFCWAQPFRSRRFPDRLVSPAAGVRGVVLLHGYLCNRGAWNLWLHRLIGEGRPFVALNLEPAFGRIDDCVPLIEEAVERITQATGLPPLLVGHSMGGVAMRAWLRQARAPHRVHRFVTLGSPHAGTWMARFGHSPNARQLRPGHPWLQALAQDSDPAWHHHFVCFYSNVDNIVFPPLCATLPGADNRLLRGLAHVQMVLRPEVMQEVLDLMDAPAPPAAP
jgi:pimeloyl-ACP methyl ester carboxylesterase